MAQAIMRWTDERILEALRRPLTPAYKRVNGVVRLFWGPLLRSEVERMSEFYMTEAGYRHALILQIAQSRRVPKLFQWEICDFIRRAPGETVADVAQNLLRGL